MNKIEWKFSKEPIPYEDAVNYMEDRVKNIILNNANELIWFLEHPPVYTLGTSTKSEDILNNNSIPVLKTNRGGRSTYHGPGQRVVYLMLDLRNKEKDIRKLVWKLEEWIIQSLNILGIKSERIDNKIGIWTKKEGDSPKKIAALGLRVRKWVTLHGISINVAPNLKHFEGIVPCGLTGDGVTSIKEMGYTSGFKEIDAALMHTFEEIFNGNSTY
jgi:lipoyl(octanoyl) transferase